jgi:outer membrane protein assembly factor BamB
MKKSVVVACLLLTSLASALAQSQNWPSWRGPSGNSVIPDTVWDPYALKSGATTLWSRMIGPGYSGVSVADGRLYAVGRTTGIPNYLAVYCLNALSGEVLWMTEVDAKGEPSATPTVIGDRLYYLAWDGTLFCLETKRGSVVWIKDVSADYGAIRPGYSWTASPLYVDGVLVIGANTRALGVDAATGDLRWAIDDPRQYWVKNPDQDSQSSAAIDTVGGKHIVYFSLADIIVAANPTTGAVLWTYAHPPGGNQDPLALGGRMYESDWGLLLTPDASAGVKVTWEAEEFFGSWPSPIALDGYLYGSWTKRNFYITAWTDLQGDEFPLMCMDLSTGKVVWKKTATFQSLIAVGKRALGLEISGVLHVYDLSPAGPTELSSAEVFPSAKKPRVFVTPPVFWQGLVYCKGRWGDLVCVDMRAH